MNKKKKELVEAKNHAEGLIHEVEKNLKEFGDKVAEADKSAITSAVEATKSALEKDNLEDIKAKTDALMQASMKLGEAMYKSQQAQGAQGQAQGADMGANASENKADEKVVDADFEEVK